MIYQKYNPCSVLQPFVECYFIWQSEEPVHNLILESPPSGFCSIVFNCGDDYFVHNKKYERLPVPRQFIAGQSIYSYQLFLNGNIHIAGIVFKPAALATLFHLPTYEYTEERISLHKVFKKTSIEKIAGGLLSAKTTVEQVKLLEEFILTYFKNDKAITDRIDLAANTILEKNGMIHVNDLLKNVFMSRRNFERKFFKKVGLSPKYFARIRRMSYLMNLIAGKKNVDWKSVLSECEFYDHSHFIKDFTEFTGRTPQEYIRENSELVHLVEKPKSQDIY